MRAFVFALLSPKISGFGHKPETYGTETNQKQSHGCSPYFTVLVNFAGTNQDQNFWARTVLDQKIKQGKLYALSFYIFKITALLSFFTAFHTKS